MNETRASPVARSMELFGGIIGTQVFLVWEGGHLGARLGDAKPQASPFSFVHIQSPRALLSFAGPHLIHTAVTEYFNISNHFHLYSIAIWSVSPNEYKVFATRARMCPTKLRRMPVPLPTTPPS